MQDLDDALESGVGWEGIPCEERERAHEVIATAYDQAGALLGACMDEGLNPALSAFDIPHFDKVRRRVERIRGNPPAEWTAYVELRPKGPGKRRPVGGISISLEQDEGTPQEGKRALSVYFMVNIADMDARRRAMQDLAKRAGRAVAHYHEYDDGPWIYRDTVLAEQMAFADVASGVRDFVSKAVVANQKRIEALVRKGA